MTPDVWWYFPLAAVVGYAAALLNTIAGGGSALTLAWLYEADLSLLEANATNRTLVMVQTSVALIALSRGGHVPWRALRWWAAPALAGAGLGAWLALTLGQRSMAIAAALLFWGLAAYLVLGREVARPPSRQPDAALPMPTVAAWLAVAGACVVGGYLQVGVGVFLVVALHRVAGWPLREANALKVVLVALYTLPILGWFRYEHLLRIDVVWALVVGSVVGAWTGARLILRLPERMLRAVLLVVLIAAGLRFLLTGLSSTG
mgnify:CR=1 FL=1